MTTETRRCKVFFPYYSKHMSAEDTLVPPPWQKRAKYVVFCSRGCTRRNLYVYVENCQHADKNSSTMDLRSPHRINPRPIRFVSGKANKCRWRLRMYQVDPWSRRREIARGVLRSPPKPEKKVYFLPSGRDWFFFVVCFLLTREQIYLYQMPGRRPPRVTGRVVNAVTWRWVGAPYERTSFRICDAVVTFFDRCLSRTRNLAASNWTFGWVFLRPILAQHLARNDFFRFFLEKFATFFFLKILCS